MCTEATDSQSAHRPDDDVWFETGPREMSKQRVSVEMRLESRDSRQSETDERGERQSLMLVYRVITTVIKK